MAQPQYTTKDLARFWSKVNKTDDPDECWEWTAGKCSFGHGTFWWKGRADVSSRVSYEIHFGDIPDGLWVLHKCDNPACCNPKHLYLGTPQRNALDRKERHRRIPASGEHHGRSVLTWEQVAEIRARWAGEQITKTSLAKEYGVSRSAIRYVLLGETWRS